MSIPNKWGFEDLGFGLGLRPQHYRFILDHWPDVDWFEIVTENYIDTEGRPLYYLDQVAERYPIVMHGVSLSIGSTDPIDFEYLHKIRDLANRVGAVWMGDHVCWTGVNGLNGHDLYPLPYTEEALAHIVKRVKIVQDFLERPLVLENPSTYLEFTESTMLEEEFIRRIADESDCALLLDVNNIYVSARNNDRDPMAYLDEVPFEHVVQIHLAGHTDKGTHCIDTHNDYVCGPVWDLYAEVCRRAGSRSTMVEWDDDIPDFPVVHSEVLKAKSFTEAMTLRTSVQP